MNKMTFYGTGGAEGIPTPFCRCNLCEYARETGGIERRRRSMFRIGEKHCIDFGPDAASASGAFGDMADLEHVLITHTHEDHFHLQLIEARAYSTPRPQWPLLFYFTDSAFDCVNEMRNRQQVYGGKLQQYEEKGLVAFRKLEFGTRTNIGGLWVTPLRGNHPDNMGDKAANYLLELPTGKKLYYAVDTGWFLPETLCALDNEALDYLVCECTWGAQPDRPQKPNVHLDLNSALSLLEELYKQGTLQDKSQVYLTHINHKQPANHAHLQELVNQAHFPCSTTVAYDGLSIPIQE